MSIQSHTHTQLIKHISPCRATKQSHLPLNSFIAAALLSWHWKIINVYHKMYTVTSEWFKHQALPTYKPNITYAILINYHAVFLDFCAHYYWFSLNFDTWASSWTDHKAWQWIWRLCVWERLKWVVMSHIGSNSNWNSHTLQALLTLCRVQHPKMSSRGRGQTVPKPLVAIGKLRCFQTWKFPYNLARFLWIITVQDFRYFLLRHFQCLCVWSKSERVF